jgi:hypothetical protein
VLATVRQLELEVNPPRPAPTNVVVAVVNPPAAAPKLGQRRNWWRQALARRALAATVFREVE